MPNEYVENVQNSTLVNDFLLAISDSNFQIESELESQIKLIEQERDVEFYKIDFNSLKNNINPSLESALSYYDDNKLLFMDEEKRSFEIISVSQNEFKDSIEIPEGFVDSEYENYLERINASKERRISHIMVDLFNYESREDAFNAIKSIQDRIGNEISFEDAASSLSEDMVSAEMEGDLGFSSGDSFPAEFEDALDEMDIGDLSEIIELDESLHIIKFTEENKETPKTKEIMKSQFINELLEAESYALMLDLRDEIEDLLLNGLSVEAIANTVNQEFIVTNPSTYKDFNKFDRIKVKDFLYGIDSASDFAEILELDDEVLLASVSEVTEPSVLPFDSITDQVFDRLREDQANLEIMDLERELILAMDDDSYALENSNVLKDSFISVKRGSTLFPQDILNKIFSSKLNSVESKKTFNSDIYIFKVNKITNPSEDFINTVISEYEEFSSTTSLVKLNLILEKEINKKIRDNIKNLNI